MDGPRNARPHLTAAVVLLHRTFPVVFRTFLFGASRKITIKSFFVLIWVRLPFPSPPLSTSLPSLPSLLVALYPPTSPRSTHLLSSSLVPCSTSTTPSFTVLPRIFQSSHFCELVNLIAVPNLVQL